MIGIRPDSAIAAPSLHHLRQALAEIMPDTEGLRAVGHERAVTLGADMVDAALGGGLIRGTLHESWPALPLQTGAATGFALALASRSAQSGKSLLLVASDFLRMEAGAPYGGGLQEFGLNLRDIIVVRVAHPRDALFAMEEALKCRAIYAVVTECAGDGVDLTATRRLALAARTGGGMGFLLRHRRPTETSAARTRWEVRGALGPRDRFGGRGPVCFLLTLHKNRRGPCGQWTLIWDHHARQFTAHSGDLAAAAFDGSADAAIAGAL